MTGGRFNHHWVTPALAVGGSFAADQIEALAHGEGIATIVDLRAETCDDVEALERHGIVHLHLPTPDRAGVSQADLARGVEFVCASLDDGRRVLIHCEHGIGRAPLLALCVLTARGMAPLAALDQLKVARPAVSPSPGQFDAWAGWLHAARAAEVPTFNSFADIAYRHQTAA